MRRAYRHDESVYDIPELRLRVDVENRQALVGRHVVNLTPKEFEVLVLFVKRPGRTFAREQLLDLVWGAEYDGDSRTVDTHIKNIREKLRSSGIESDPIATVWGVGYKFEASV